VVGKRNTKKGCTKEGKKRQDQRSAGGKRHLLVHGEGKKPPRPKKTDITKELRQSGAEIGRGLGRVGQETRREFLGGGS